MEILYFEDVVVGEKRTSSVTYTAKKKEIIEFAAAWDPRYFHVDEAEALFPVTCDIIGGATKLSAADMTPFGGWRADLKKQDR